MALLVTERTATIDELGLTVMVPVDDAMDYGRDLVAGFDNLLLELADNLDSGLPDSLPESQRQAIHAHIDREIARTCEAVEECG